MVGILSPRRTSCIHSKSQRCKIKSVIPKAFVASISVAAIFCEHSMAFTLPPVPVVEHYNRVFVPDSIGFDFTNQCPYASLYSTQRSRVNNSIYRRRSIALFVRKQKPMPIVGYDGDDICEYYDRRPFVVGWRLNRLSLPLLGEYLIFDLY